MTTIRDIAREAGVSVSTVSRVISGKPDVAAATVARVQEVIGYYHFEVNRNARFLKQADTATILVIVKGRHNLLFASMLEAVQQAITDYNHSTATRYIDEDDDEVAEAERLLGEFKPRGVVFLGGDTAHFEASGRNLGITIPAVVLTNQTRSAAHPLLSSVSTDDRVAGQMAVDYLLANGHRLIGVIGGNPAVSAISAWRLQGARESLARAGGDLGDRWIATHYALDCGYQAGMELIQRCGELTAVYAMSDLLALGAMRALHDSGRRIGRDVSVIGHDGIELGSFTIPRLTTIRQPQAELARRGVDLLMNEGSYQGVNELLDVELVEGESVRQLAA